MEAVQECDALRKTRKWVDYKRAISILKSTGFKDWGSNSLLQREDAPRTVLFDTLIVFEKSALKSWTDARILEFAALVKSGQKMDKRSVAWTIGNAFLERQKKRQRKGVSAK